MKNGSLSQHKKTKFGMLPGDIPKSAKIQMLEKGTLQTHAGNPAKTYKRDFVRIANRRARRTPIESE